jgi:hypothetical protein
MKARQMVKYIFSLKNVLIVCSSAVLFACNNESADKEKSEKDTTTATISAPMNNQLTEDEKKEGWELLFDGTTTKGWHRYGNTPVGAAWKVADGNIYLDATNKKDWQIRDGGDILTTNGPGIPAWKCRCLIIMVTRMQRSSNTGRGIFMT